MQLVQKQTRACLEYALSQISDRFARFPFVVLAGACCCGTTHGSMLLRNLNIAYFVQESPGGSSSRKTHSIFVVGHLVPTKFHRVKIALGQKAPLHLQGGFPQTLARSHTLLHSTGQTARCRCSYRGLRLPTRPSGSGSGCLKSRIHHTMSRNREGWVVLCEQQLHPK